MKKQLLAVLLAITTAIHGQNELRTCGTPELPQQFESWLQSIVQSQTGKLGQSQIQSVFNIPVIVHIIHNNEAINSISATTGNNLNAAQVIDQINILNKDFNGTNSDTSLIPNVFKPFKGKFNINFCLAVVNPTGGILAEPGINRIDRVAKGWNSLPYSQTYINSTVKPNSIWDPNRYLNIWVCPLSSGLLGYATFPNPGTSGLQGLTGSFGTSTTDGVVIRSSSFGSIGTGQFGQYNKGRTTTHEIGHWLGLRHIWGDGTCATDYCNDTPPAQNANYNCPSFPYKLGTCSGNTTGEMTMNYMDYTDDACMYMFSNDQKVRAQLILTHSAIRAALITSTVCNLPNVINDAGISYISSPTYSQTINCPAVLNPVIQLTNFGSNALTSAIIAYNVNGVNTQTLSWTGNLAPSSSSLVSLPQLTVASGGAHTYSVNISSPNGGADANLLNNNSIQSFFVSSNFLSVTGGSTCPGVPFTISASGASTYSWSTGATTASVSVSPGVSTVYNVSGTVGACNNSKTVTVTVIPLPTVSINNTSVCANTDATITASGAGTYSWSTGSTSNSTTLNLSSGSTFTVTGFSNLPQCFTHKIFTVTVNLLPLINLSANHLACATCSNGSISANVSAGTGPFVYLWTPGNFSTPDITDLGEGCYTLTVTDAMGCSATDSACVYYDVSIRIQKALAPKLQLTPNPSPDKFLVSAVAEMGLEYTVSDILGRIILSGNNSKRSFEIDLGNYPPGIYYLKVTAPGYKSSYKLIKEQR